LYEQRIGAPVIPDVREVDTGGMSELARRANLNTMPANKITDAEFQSAIAEYRDGASIGAIADHLPVTRQSLWMRFKRAGVEMRPQRRFADENHFYRGGPRGADWAHNRVEKAVARGQLQRPEVCSQCGGYGVAYKDGRSRIHAHHDDYNRPLDVRWLCKGCHHLWHIDHEPLPLREEVRLAEAAADDSIDVISGGFP
jgi:hypothetical protein